MKVAYPAILHKEGNGYWVMFPDVDGCFSDGETVADTISNASEALGMHLCSFLDQGEELPSVSNIEALHPEDGFATLVVTDPYLYKKNTRAVKKTLTIPEWLDQEAQKKHINFSNVLKQALIAAISVK